MCKLTLDQIFGFSGDEAPDLVTERYRIVDGLSCGLFVIIWIERKHATKEYIDDHTKTPKIYVLSIGSLNKDLRSNIRLPEMLV